MPTKTLEPPTPIEGLVTPHDSLTVKAFAPDSLQPNPQNPRGPVAEKDVQDLLELVRVFGQKVPALVRPMPDGDHQVVLGHRRRVVAKILGVQLQCFVEELSDDVALALMLSEQNSAKAFDAFAESDAVAELLSRPGWTLLSVSTALGKDLRYIASRANLRNLTKTARKLIEKNEVAKGWPLDCLEEVAKLAPDAQEAFFKSSLWGITTREKVVEAIAKETSTLGAAPFSITDEALVPKAGACTTCPKNSARSPGLFDDGLEPIDVKKATCRDFVCWAVKVEAHSKQKLAQLREENPKAIAIVHHGQKAIPGVSNVVPAYDLRDAKKGDEGAVPAVDFETGRVKHVVPYRDAPSTSASRHDKPKAKSEVSEKERERLSRIQVHNQRLAHVVDGIRAAIAKASPPGDETLSALVTAYGCERPATYGASLKTRKKLFESIWGDEVWKRSRSWVAESIQRPSGLDRVSEIHEAAVWLAGLLAIDVGKLEREAVVEIPDKKFWGKADAASSPAARAKAKRAGKSPSLPTKSQQKLVAESIGAAIDRAKGDVVVRCRGCNASSAEQAAGGRAWPEKDLCSYCGGNQPSGKPKKSKAK